LKFAKSLVDFDPQAQLLVEQKTATTACCAPYDRLWPLARCQSFL